MPSPQLLKILRSFNKEDLESFNDFIYSPFHNKSRTIHKLWEEIKKYSPGFDSPDLEKEKLFKKVFMSKEYNYGTMKNLIHTFTGLNESFLELRFHYDEKFQQDYNSLHFCLIKYYPELFNKKFQKIMKAYENKCEGSDYHYLYKYQLTRLSSCLLALESRQEKIIFEQGESLIYFFLIHLFQVYFNIHVYIRVGNTPPDSFLVDEMLKLLDLKTLMERIKENNEMDYQVVSLYYHMYLSIKEPENDEYFYKFKSSVVGSKPLIDNEEFKSMANTVMGTLQNRLFKGIPGSQNETAEFFKQLFDMQHSFANTDDKIGLYQFSFILKIFFANSDLEHAESFYKLYSNKLLKNDQERMKNYYMAYLSFAKKDFSNALQFSSRIKYETDKYKLHVKEFELKCYYEMNDPEGFSFTLNSYRQAVYRDEQLPEERKELTKNFINAANSLFEIKGDGKGKLEDVKYEIANNRMYNKLWITKKMEELASPK